MLESEESPTSAPDVFVSRCKSTPIALRSTNDGENILQMAVKHICKIAIVLWGMWMICVILFHRSQLEKGKKITRAGKFYWKVVNTNQIAKVSVIVLQLLQRYSSKNRYSKPQNKSLYLYIYYKYINIKVKFEFIVIEKRTVALQHCSGHHLFRRELYTC